MGDERMQSLLRTFMDRDVLPIIEGHRVSRWKTTATR
jgi:hypothetical protein